MAKNKNKNKKKDSEGVNRLAYAVYRKRMARSPDTILDTLNFNVWKKARENTARPGE